MKKRFYLILLLLIAAYISKGALWQKFEKSAFYQAMASANIERVNNELDALQNAPAGERDGYEGALLMRKAGLVSRPQEKLRLFKSGRIKFQTAYNADSTNVEFHFLRLAIQEHAPKIVKYHGDLLADKAYIKAHFKRLDPVVQRAVVEYAHTSKVLSPGDF